MADPGLTTRQRVQRRVGALEQNRTSWLAHWQDINRVLLPRTGDFLGTTTQQGNRRNTDILDNTGTAALGVLKSGMLSGMTSPARPWLKVETANSDLMESKPVSMWCDQVTQKLRNILGSSNAYQVLHSMYGGLGAYGTSASLMLGSDTSYENIIWFCPLAIGQFALGLDKRGEVNSISVRNPKTVEQIVSEYVARPDGTMDWARASVTVKNLWDRHDADAMVPVTQLIQPRILRDSSMADARNMPFESVHIEDGADGDRVLRDSGFKRFPGVVMRWEVEGQDIYGSNCPGMVALGDIQQLQVEQAKKSKAIDYMADPPVQAPFSLKNQETDLLPGGLTFVDMVGPHGAIRSAFDVNLRLDHLLQDLQDVRGRVNNAFYADLFLFLSNLNGRGDRTAREVAEIHEEKLLMLGPVVERIETALHIMVDRVYEIADNVGILPPPPPEIAGRNGQLGEALKVEFIGLLSQAQRAVSMSSVDRIIGATASIAAAMQSMEPWDNIDTDITIGKAGGYLGVDPEILRGKDQVKAIRDARAKAMAAQQQAEQAANAAKAAKDLAGADMSSNNALTNLVRGFSPAGLQ